jgi:hypothetical protein
MSVKRGGLTPVMSVNDKRGGLTPVMSVNDKRGGLTPVMSANDKRGGLTPVMSVNAKADVVRAQDAAKAIRLNFMVWAPLYFGKGIADRREMVIPIGKSDARMKIPSAGGKKSGRRARSRPLKPAVVVWAPMTSDL